jgi:hypothetical protein
MSRSGVYYVIRAMERAAAGPAVTGAPRAPARRAVDGEAAARPDDSVTSVVRRMLAAVHRGIGGAPGAAGRWRRRLSGPAQAEQASGGRQGLEAG